MDGALNANFFTNTSSPCGILLEMNGYVASLSSVLQAKNFIPRLSRHWVKLCL